MKGRIARNEEVVEYLRSVGCHAQARVVEGRLESEKCAPLIPKRTVCKVVGPLLQGVFIVMDEDGPWLYENEFELPDEVAPAMRFKQRRWCKVTSLPHMVSRSFILPAGCEKKTCLANFGLEMGQSFEIESISIDAFTRGSLAVHDLAIDNRVIGSFEKSSCRFFDRLPCRMTVTREAGKEDRGFQLVLSNLTQIKLFPHIMFLGTLYP